MQAKPDYYGVLGLSREAKAAEIKAAVQKLVSDFQAAGKPKNIGEVEEIRSIVTAYRVLSDAEKRRRYDETGRSFLGDENNRLAAVHDKLDDLLQSLHQSTADSSSDIMW